MSIKISAIVLFIYRIAAPIIQFAHWVAKPHISIIDVAERHKAQLTSGLSLALALTSVGGLVAALSSQGYNLNSYQPQKISFIIGFFLAVISYFLSRTKFPGLGSLGLVFTYLVSGFYLAFFGSDDPAFSLLTTVPLSFIFASVLFPSLGTFLLTILVTILAFLVPYFNPAGGSRETSAVAGQFLTWGVLFLVVNASRNAIEHDRLEESQKLNLELQILQASLEERIQERTNELKLTSELGQILSQVRELDSLIYQTVSLIQERFDLYYTQIYLVDEKSQVLVLQAGSGQVGEILKQRGHRLPIDTSSLNGRAAHEKRPVVVEDTGSVPGFRLNPLLPDTHSEMSIPLIIRDRVVGVLDIQSNKTGELNQTQLPVYTSLAGQLAIAIEKAKLLDQVLVSGNADDRTMHGSIRKGWSDYLNAIDNQEKISASFVPDNTQFSVQLMEEGQETSFIDIPITVAGEIIGSIQLQHEKNKELRQDQVEFTQNVANQIAQQVENLRLLSQAEQYRLEAEAMLSQSARWEWQSLLEKTYDGKLAVIYDHNQIFPMDPTKETNNNQAIIEKIKVQDEIIGELAVSGISEGDKDTQELLRSVSEQLGVHLENLRLGNETRKALAFSEHQAASLTFLNELATQLSSANSKTEVLQVSIKKGSRILNSEYSSIVMVTPDENMVELYTISGNSESPLVGVKLPKAGTLFVEVIDHNQMIILPEDNPKGYNHLRGVPLDAEMGIQAFMSAPLVVGGHVVGAVNTGTSRSVFTESERNIFNQVVLLTRNALENRTLLEQTQLLAHRERSLRQITSRVRSYTDPETILRIGTSELGSVVGRNVIIQLGNIVQDTTNLVWREFQEIANVPAYFYNKTSVLPVTEAEIVSILSLDNGKASFITIPLALRGIDKIGMMAINNDPERPITEDDLVFFEQISEQIALALESARLFTQTQRALAETDALYTIISELNSARDYDAILAVLAQRTILANADQSLIMFLFDHALGKDNIPEWVIPIAQHSTIDIRLAERYPLNAFEITPNTLFTNTPVLLEKVLEDGRLDRITRTLFHDVFLAKSSVIIPLLLGNQSMGFILGNFGEYRTFSDAEVRRLSTITSQVAIAVQGMQLLEQTLVRARREQLLREVTNQVNNAAGVDEILRRAVEQVGRVLKRPVYAFLGTMPEGSQEESIKNELGNNGSNNISLKGE